MCSRYFLGEGAVKALQENLNFDFEVEIKIESDGKETALSSGKSVIHPGDKAEVMILEGSRIVLRRFLWGIPIENGAGGKRGLIFNARAESALEKRLFRDSVMYRRCMIPASGFFEWNHLGEKAVFEENTGGLLYFAGFFQNVGEEVRFVILTTDANQSVGRVHERMPLILEQDQIEDWLRCAERTEAFLKERPKELRRRMEFEQQSFTFF